jgi:hypothetical protein
MVGVVSFIDINYGIFYRRRNYPPPLPVLKGGEKEKLHVMTKHEKVKNYPPCISIDE